MWRQSQRRDVKSCGYLASLQVALSALCVPCYLQAEPDAGCGKLEGATITQK
jgi:hypothetical protein